MTRREQIPVALTIAGSDSGGGAGVQADLKTFAALGVHGTTALTCITAQNPKRVSGIQACSPQIVRQQIEAVVSELRPAAVKTGMLYSTELIRIVVDFFRSHRSFPLVIDPVMVSTSGSRLLKSSAIRMLKKELVPLATLVTPNLDETAILAGHAPRSIEEMRSAARLIHREFGCAVLVKGGHLRNVAQAADIFFDGDTELLLAAPFTKGVSTHGTGCTYSAAITAWLARGKSLTQAVELGKEFITQAISQSQFAGSHSLLNSFWR